MLFGNIWIKQTRIEYKKSKVGDKVYVFESYFKKVSGYKI